MNIPSDTAGTFIQNDTAHLSFSERRSPELTLLGDVDTSLMTFDQPGEFKTCVVSDYHVLKKFSESTCVSQRKLFLTTLFESPGMLKQKPVNFHRNFQSIFFFLF